MKLLKTYWWLVFFGLLYSLVLVVNHFNFRTPALDLGLYTNSLFDYRLFRFHDTLLLKGIPENFFSDHFDLYLPFLSILSWVFGNETLIYVHIIALLTGGYGVHLYFKETRFRFTAPLFFLSFFAVFSSLEGEYHSSTVAACLLPFLFLANKKGDRLTMILMSLLILISKENTGIWLSVTLFSMGFLPERNKNISLFLPLTLSMFSIFYSVLCLTVIMPSFSGSHEFHHFHYSILGTNLTEAVTSLITKPQIWIPALFQNHFPNESLDYIKTELWFFLIFCGLPILVLRWQFALMIFPILLQKLLHDNATMWGIYLHYSIEFAPIFAIGVFSFLKGEKRLHRIGAWVLLALCIGVTIRSMDRTVSYSNKDKLRFYQSKHYSPVYSKSDFKDIEKKIDKSGAVSIQSDLVPHFALRDSLYRFPHIYQSQQILVSIESDAWPFTEEEKKKFLDSLVSNEVFEKGYQNQSFTLYERLK